MIVWAIFLFLAVVGAQSDCLPWDLGLTLPMQIGANPCPAGMDYAKVDRGIGDAIWYDGATNLKIPGATISVTWGVVAGKAQLSSWQSIGGVLVDLMIYKCDTWQSYFWYVPPASEDVGLVLNCTDETSKVKDISNVGFCRIHHVGDIEVTVPVNPTVVQVERYDWHVEKSIDPTTVTIMDSMPPSITPIVTMRAWSTPKTVGACAATISIDYAVHNPTMVDAHVVSVDVVVYDHVDAILVQQSATAVPYDVASGATVSFHVEYALPSCTDDAARVEVIVVTDAAFCESNVPTCNEPFVLPPQLECCIRGTCSCVAGPCGATASANVPPEHVISTPCVDVYDTVGCEHPVPMPGDRLAQHLCPPMDWTIQMAVNPLELTSPGTRCDRARVCLTDTPPSSNCIYADAILVIVAAPTPPSPIIGCTRTIGYWKTHAGIQYGNNPDVVKNVVHIFPGHNKLVIGSDSKLPDGCLRGVLPTSVDTLVTHECYDDGTLQTTSSADVSLWVTPSAPMFVACSEGKATIRRQLWMQLTAVELNLAAIFLSTNYTIPSTGIDPATDVGVSAAMATAIYDAHHILHRFECNKWECRRKCATSTDFAAGITYHERATVIEQMLDAWNNGLGSHPHCD
jgi:hypothetical protein